MAQKQLDSLHSAIDQSGLDVWEIIYDQHVSNPVTFDYDRIKEIDYKESSGFGLRAVVDGRLGFVATTDPTRLVDLPEQVKASAAFGETAGFDFPGENDFPKVKTAHKSTRNFSRDTAIERGERTIARIKAELPAVQAGAVFRPVWSKRRIVNSSGLDASYEQTVLGVSVSGILVEGDSIQGVYEGHGSCRDDADMDAMITKVIERFAASAQLIKLQSGVYPVVFTPKALLSLLAAIRLGANGRTVQKGASPLSEKLNETIVDSRITLIDDPLMDYYPGSRPFDDEGMPSQKNTIIENGVLKNFVFDLQTASRMNLRSTASAGRGFSSPPSPSFSTLVMTPGTEPIDELVGKIGKGILVDQVLGGGQSNLLMGEFSLNIDLGFTIEHGEITGRIKNAMVAGNVYDAFCSVDSLSLEREYYGGALLPSILFQSLSVSTNH